jgi:hypothetical protein
VIKAHNFTFENKIDVFSLLSFVDDDIVSHSDEILAFLEEISDDAIVQLAVLIQKESGLFDSLVISVELDIYFQEVGKLFEKSDLLETFI